MRHWNSRKALLSLTAILIMVLSLAFMGCGDDHGDDGRRVVVEDLAVTDICGRTFILPASFFNPLLTGNARVRYGPCDTVVDNTVSFRLTFTDAPNTVINGTAEVNSITLTVTQILVNDVSVNTVSIGEPPNEVTLSAVDPQTTFTFDTEIAVNSDGSIEIIWINENGDRIVFVFESPDDTGATGGTGSTGGD